MKVVAYNIEENEKELLAKANAKMHDLTLISNALNLNTVQYAEGKEVIIVSDRDRLDKNILDKLHLIGVKKIITRSVSLHHIDTDYAGVLQLHIANTPSADTSQASIAEQTIQNLNNWNDDNCLGAACQCGFDCAKRIEALKNK